MPGEPDKPFMSLVALLSEHAPLPESELLAALDRAFDGCYTRKDPGYFFKAVIDGLQYLVWCCGSALVIHNYANQYFDGPSVAEYISDPELSRDSR